MSLKIREFTWKKCRRCLQFPPSGKDEWSFFLTWAQREPVSRPAGAQSSKSSHAIVEKAVRNVYFAWFSTRHVLICTYILLKLICMNRRVSLPCLMMQRGSAYTVTGLLLLGPNTLSCTERMCLAPSRKDVMWLVEKYVLSFCSLSLSSPVAPGWGR